MEITKRTLFLSLFASFLSLIVSIVCACVLEFKAVALIVLGGVVITNIIACVLCWRVVRIANKNR